MRTTRVFIIHPQRLVCVALRDLMEKFGDLMVVGVSCDFAGAQAALADGTIDVFLMADRLEDCTGVSALKRIRQDHLHTSPLFDYMATRYGAGAVLPASCGYSELVAAVRGVHEGTLEPMQSRMAGRARKLSAREMDVLAGILEGKSLGETAEELGISDKTVSTYKNRLFHKLGVKSAVELVGMYNCGNGVGSLFQ